MNKKGIISLYASILMLIVFMILTVVWKIGSNDITLSMMANDTTKAYYLAESGIYYGGSAILDAIQNSTEPLSSQTKTNPFSEYKAPHSFTITITKEETDYRVVSEGFYKNRSQKIEALITISGNTVLYSQMRKIS